MTHPAICVGMITRTHIRTIMSPAMATLRVAISSEC